MGTSTDRTGGTGGAWTPLKRAATAYAKSAEGGSGGSRIRAERVLSRHVEVLGGVAGATASAIAGRSALTRLGALAAGISNVGLAQTLTDVGLGHLVGQDRFDVLDELITLIAGDGSDVEAQAARDAACDVLDDLFAGSEQWDDLERRAVTEADLVVLLSMYLARYIYNRLPVLAERLARFSDPAAAHEADLQIISLVRDLVDIHLPDSPLTFDWGGPAGEAFAQQTIREVYSILDALGGGDR